MIVRDLCGLRYAPIAQLVEQLPFKEWVVGSTPTGRTDRFGKILNMKKPTTPLGGVGRAFCLEISSLALRRAGH